MTESNLRSNTFALLAGHGAFFVFSAQQVIQSTFVSIEINAALVAIPVIAAFGVIVSYISLLAPDYFKTFPHKSSDRIEGLIFGTSAGILFMLLLYTTYLLAAHGGQVIATSMGSEATPP